MQNDKEIDKQYISAQQLIEDSFRLAAMILKSGFEPNFIVAIWRGGTPVGIAVQEFLDYFGIETDHIAIRTSAYQGIDDRIKQIRVHGLNYIVENANTDDTLLIVDDVYDTGLSIRAVIENLREKARKNTPHDIRVAAAYFKPSRNQTERVPDYFIHETEKWLIFPHEMDGLTREEIFEHKQGIKKIIDEYMI
ncbi:MAG: phosphoribosyltransferase [Planctomycetota bacterium]|jgi:hypoxanthine phosphoribosyltransferase